jgi:Ca2+-binding EF-hand superfamily protein
VEKYPVLDNKPAMMRAYKQTTLREGDGDAWVERAEFPALLRNLLYFNKLFSIFDDIDKDDDRRLTFEEFKAGSSKIGLRLSEKDAAAAFDAMDSNDGGKVLFDEFCVYVAKTSIPVDGETKKTFTTNDDR